MTWKWLKLSHYHAFVVFLFMGVCTALFAWTSYNLLHYAMENVRLLRDFGLMAALDGGLWQLLGIIFYGYLSLGFYVGFNACETELVYRWRAWKAEK